MLILTFKYKNSNINMKNFSIRYKLLDMYIHIIIFFILFIYILLKKITPSGINSGKLYGKD